MSTGIDRLASQLQKTITERDKSKKTGYYAQSEVVKVDDDVVWVKIPGGIDETPVSKTADAKVGDKVQVRVEGGRAWIAGNYTSPPTDDTRANSAYVLAETADENADIAKSAAESALKDAEVAHNAAESAQESAESASVSANTALVQLGTVEDVVGTLNWISQHGDFDVTEDKQVDPNKRYYEQVFDYVKTSDTAIVSGKDYYTRSGSGTDDNPYIFTLVSNPVASHLDDYYELSSIGYEYYPMVEGNPQELGLYELVSIDSAVTNYISKHLALTNSGLWLTGDEGNYKILLDDHGLYIYGPNGLVSSFGEDIVFSSDSNQRIGNDSTYVEFDHVNQKLNIVADELHIGNIDAGNVINAQQQQLNELTGYVDINTNEGYIRVGKTDADSYVQIDGNNARVVININGKDVAYMSGDRFYAPSAVVTNLYMKTELSGSAVGDIGWVMRSNGHLSLKRIR